MTLRPSRVIRPHPQPEWLMPPQNGLRGTKPMLRVVKHTPLHISEQDVIKVEQAGQVIEVLPEFVDELIERLVAARDWEDQS